MVRFQVTSAWQGQTRSRATIESFHLGGQEIKRHFEIDVGLSRDWGSCHDGCWRMRIVGGLEALPEAGAERAVVDGAADLEQPIGTAPRPAHLLRFVHAT